MTETDFQALEAEMDGGELGEATRPRQRPPGPAPLRHCFSLVTLSPEWLALQATLDAMRAVEHWSRDGLVFVFQGDPPERMAYRWHRMYGRVLTFSWCGRHFAGAYRSRSKEAGDVCGLCLDKKREAARSSATPPPVKQSLW